MTKITTTNYRSVVFYQDNPRINVEPHTPWILFQELKTPEELWKLVKDYVVSVRIVVVYQANLNL